MNQPNLTADTPVIGKVAFREKTGSIFPYSFHKTLGELGVKFDGKAAVSRPTPQEEEAAIEADRQNLPRDYANSQLGRLQAKYFAQTMLQNQDPVTRLRENLNQFFLTGGVPDHPIDNGNYAWEGGPNSMNVNLRTDDETGSATGKPGAVYLQVVGTAVWGAVSLGHG